MGIVFRAHDTRLGRDVALKCPWPHLSEDAVARHRFLREARATSRLAHPTIVPVYEVFEDRQLPWIAMELVEAHTTLADSLVSGEPLPLEQILEHAEDLADALRAAHAKGILHRDIKPSNVLLGPDGRARLTDFGLARFFAPADKGEGVPVDESSSLTLEGKVVGTIAYMAPEVLLGGGTNPDPRSDLFSLGVLIYEMCTGRAAFVATSNYDVYNAVLQREPPAIGRFNYEVPRSLERIVRKALAKRPDERYQDARDLLADVRAVRRRIASGERDFEDDFIAGRRWSRARTWTWLGCSAAAVILSAWLGHVASRGTVGQWGLGTPRQLTTAPGAETDAAISPDGTFVAYASDESGNFDIWLVDSRGGNPIRLTDDPRSDRHPAWFPDGSAIAFVSDRGGTTGIWKVARLGGSATLLVPDAEDPAISHDGKRIAFIRSEDSAYPRIYVGPVSAHEKARPLLAGAVGRWGQYRPAWSPDDRSICFGDFEHLWLADSEGRDARQLTATEYRDENPTWSGDGRTIYFSSFRDGTLALWEVSVKTGKQARVSYGSGPEGGPSISRSGSAIAFSTYADDRDVALRDLTTGAFVRVPSQLTDYAPDLSPDSRRLIFNTDRWGSLSTVALLELDKLRPSGKVKKLTDWSTSLPRFSPDGKWIAFWRNLQGNRDVWVMPSEGGEAVRFEADPAADMQPSWSPDGRMLAFVSERGGTSAVWTKQIQDGRPVGDAIRVTSDPGGHRFPEWSPDGRFIAYVRASADGMDIWVVSATGGGERRVTRGANAELARWVGGSEEMLVSGMWNRVEYEIRRVDVATGESRSLDPPVLCGTDGASALFDVDASGTTMATTIRETRGDVWMIQALPGSF